MGGEFNVHTHHEEFSQLLQNTSVIDFSKHNDMQHIPTYKRISYQLDNVLISEGLIYESRNVHILAFNIFFLSDHSALVFDLDFHDTVIPNLPKPRSLNSSNNKNTKKISSGTGEDRRGCINGIVRREHGVQ